MPSKAQIKARKAFAKKYAVKGKKKEKDPDIAHNKRIAKKYLATHKPIKEKLTLTGKQRNWLYRLLASLSKDPDFFDRNDLLMVNSLMSSLSLHYDSTDD